MQQVKDPTAVARVAVEMWVRSLVWELKYAMIAAPPPPKKKKKKEKKKKKKKKTAAS